MKIQKAKLDRWMRGTPGFILVWLLLPAVPYFLLWAHLAIVRVTFTIFYVLTGLLNIKSRILGIVIFAWVIGINLIFFISDVFRLSIPDIMRAASQANAVSITADPLYVFVGGATIVSIILTIFLGCKYQPKPSLKPLLLVLIPFVAMDFAFNFNLEYRMSKWLADYQDGEAVESATDISGFKQDIETYQGRKFLVVMVEALGKLQDNSIEKSIVAPLENLSQTHQLSVGAVKSFGSTTSAEIREFCGKGGSHLVVMYGKIDPALCLPHALNEQGLKTKAFHGFDDRLFDRELWYPKIGFDDNYFGWNAVLPESRDIVCGSVFGGACDFYVADKINQTFRDDEADFVYWLTLNTHIPVKPHESIPDQFDCTTSPDPFPDVRSCEIANVWYDLFGDIAVLAQSHPDLHILIVGDHPPPLFSRAGRKLFDTWNVPWFYLKPAG